MSLNMIEPSTCSDCEQLSGSPNNTVEGKVVLCFTTRTNEAIIAVRNAGGLGVIIARNPTHLLRPSVNFPSVAVDFELGTDILFYIRSTRYLYKTLKCHFNQHFHGCEHIGFCFARSPIVKIHASRTLVGHPVATKVATFSSRGPNSISPAILKVYQTLPYVSNHKTLARISVLQLFDDRFSVNTAGYSSTWCEHTSSYFS